MPTATLQTFTQRFQGTMTTFLRPGTPHCGPMTSAFPIQGTFDVRLKITFNQDALDEHGFLLDNTFFAGYFDTFKHCQIAISCERLACLIASDMAFAVGNRLCKCAAIEVSLKPVNGVWVSCTYHGGLA